MRRIWGMARDTIMEYICSEPDGFWYYSAVPMKEGVSFDRTKARAVPRDSAIRKVKMWGFPLSDKESDEET